MGGDAYENGEDDQGKTGKRIDGKGAGSEFKPCARACGQAGGDGLLGIAMIEPENNEAERQVEDKDAWKTVAEAAVVRIGNEVLKIGGKAADDQGRHDETCAAEWQSRGCMGEGKRHTTIMTVLAVGCHSV